MAAAVPEQGAGELDEAAVVGWLLVVADEECAALLKPGEGALDYPAAGGMSLLAPAVELLLADPADVRDVSGVRAGRLAGGVVIPLVQTEVLRDGIGVGARDHDRFDRLREELGVVDVRTGDRGREGPTVFLDQYALLGAHLGSVSGVWASRAAREAALAHRAVSGLPFPAHAAELLTLPDQVVPDLLQQPVRGEPLKPAVDGRARTEPLGQIVPLTPRAQPVDDPVQHPP